jgi:hypothetical protein
MQSTGQTSTHAVSLVPTHGSQMMNANPFIILAIAATLKGSPYAWIDAVSESPRAWTDASAAQEASAACDPALTGLFTPARPARGRYQVCTSERPLEGDAEALEALDAFGAGGSYDRAALQRLYGGARVRVQRSWTVSGGEFVSTTRLSPYPDASLTRLRPGTMEIRWTLNR